MNDNIYESCEREPLAFFGTVQDIGFLLVVDTETGTIYAVSENVFRFLGRSSRNLVGCDLSSVLKLGETFGSWIERARTQQGVPREMTWYDFEGDENLLLVTTHVVGKQVFLEVEGHEKPRAVDTSFLSKHDVISDLKRELVKTVFRLFEFDRVMYYHFRSDYSGFVEFECCRESVQSYLNHHFPAADIPKIARNMYFKNKVRYIADISRKPSRIIASGDPHQIDLSYTQVRAVSHYHLEYMRNMGTYTSLSAGVMCDDKLVAVVACHSVEPKKVSCQKRYQLAQLVTTFEQCLQRLVERHDKDQEDYLVNLVSEIKGRGDRELTPRAMFQTMSQFLIKHVHADSVIVYRHKNANCYGDIPDETFRGSFLTYVENNRVSAFESHNLHQDSNGEVPFNEKAAGCVLIPIDDNGFIAVFRGEQRVQRLWGGDSRLPTLPYNGMRIEPRKSFETFVEEVKETCESWLPWEVRLVNEVASILT